MPNPLPLSGSPPVLEPIENITVIETEDVIIYLNASDPDNDTLTFGTDASQVLPSTFYFNSISGLFEWTSTIDDSGNYTINFTVTDGNLSDFKTTTIEVLDTIDDDNRFGFDPREIKQLLREHLSCKADNNVILCDVMHLVLLDSYIHHRGI